MSHDITGNSHVGSELSSRYCWVNDLRCVIFLRAQVKWNKIEHRLFCHITQNWRGRPLTSLQVVINLIRNTTTRQGLEVEARKGWKSL